MNNGRTAPVLHLKYCFFFFFSKTLKRMKAIIVTTATMIVNIHGMENKLTSIYSVKKRERKKAACRQNDVRQKQQSVVRLCSLAQRNRKWGNVGHLCNMCVFVLCTWMCVCMSTRVCECVVCRCTLLQRRMRCNSRWRLYTLAWIGHLSILFLNANPRGDTAFFTTAYYDDVATELHTTGVTEIDFQEKHVSLDWTTQSYQGQKRKSLMLAWVYWTHSDCLSTQGVKGGPWQQTES